MIIWECSFIDFVFEDFLDVMVRFCQNFSLNKMGDYFYIISSLLFCYFLFNNEERDMYKKLCLRFYVFNAKWFSKHDLLKIDLFSWAYI